MIASHVGKQGRPVPSRSRLLAVSISLFLHGLVWLGVSSLSREADPPRSAPPTRVVLSEGEAALFLDRSSGRERKESQGAEEGQEFSVKVEQPPPIREDVGLSGPVVRPRQRGSQGNGSRAGSDPASIGGGPGGASFYQLPVGPGRIVFVVDRSLSMGRGGALVVARGELTRCLKSLQPGSEFQIVLYNRSPACLPSSRPDGLIELSPDCLSWVGEVLRATRPEGATDHERALTMALGFQPDVIFLVTDADDLTPEQVRRITTNNRNHCAIHAIQVGGGRSTRGRLRELTQANRGSFHLPGALTGPR